MDDTIEGDVRKRMMTLGKVAERPALDEGQLDNDFYVTSVNTEVSKSVLWFHYQMSH